MEIGVGSGVNVPQYRATVSRLAAVEPSDVAWKLAADRLVASAVRVERAGLDGQSLPFEDDTFDSALSTWTMCTILDIEAALAELRRVWRPGGSLHFVEHGGKEAQSLFGRALPMTWSTASPRRPRRQPVC